MSEHEPPSGPPPLPPSPPPPGPPAPAPPATPPAAPSVERLPWEDRERLGFAPALVESFKLFVTDPVGAFKRTARQGDYVGPLIWALLFSFLGFIVSQFWGLLFGQSMTALLPGDLKQQMAFQGGSGCLQTAISLILAPIIIPVVLFIWSGIVHLCLTMLGGVDPEAGFEGTFRSAAYASVTNVAQVVPFVGGFVAAIWSLVLQVLGIVELHRTSTGKAAGAVLIPVVVCCVCVIAGIFLFAATVLTALGAAAAGS